MRFFMFIYSIIILLFTPLWAHATADGPDYFKNKINHSVYLYKNANAYSVILAQGSSFSNLPMLLCDTPNLNEIETQYLECIAYLQSYLGLMKADIKADYLCGKDQNLKLTAHFYNHTAVATVKIAYNGKTDILLQKVSASGARYVGIMGQLFWIKGNEAIFKPGKNTAEYQCITND